MTRRQNEITMAAANAIKSKRIIELTSGEAGIVNHTDKIYLLDWMQTYQEYQEKRDKKGIGQIKAVTQYPERICRGKIYIGSGWPRFRGGYIDSHADNLPPKGKPIAATTRNTYYQIFNGALNAAVQANGCWEIRLTRWKSRRSPNAGKACGHLCWPSKRYGHWLPLRCRKGEVKNAYLFSCSAGLRISDIVGLKWKNVFVDNGQYRLAVAMQEDQKNRFYLPLSNEALKWMPEREDKAADDPVFQPAFKYQSVSQTVGRSGRNHQAFYFSHRPAAQSCARCRVSIR